MVLKQAYIIKLKQKSAIEELLNSYCNVDRSVPIKIEYN